VNQIGTRRSLVHKKGQSRPQPFHREQKVAVRQLRCPESLRDHSDRCGREHLSGLHREQACAGNFAGWQAHLHG
jgi:hypothetical protein